MGSRKRAVAVLERVIVRAEEKMRNELVEAYESSSPAEQALVQLCSIIYEPVSMAVLYKIFHKTGLSFPEEKIRSAKAMESHLTRLKTLSLLDDNCQVPRQIIEIITRRALAAGRIFHGSDFLKGIESEQAWTDKLPIGSHCISCARVIQGKVQDKTFITTQGPLCLSCTESELKILSADESLADWSARRILDALSPDGDIRSRLTVIWRFNEVLRVLTLKRMEDVAGLLTLLVQNLGYSHRHPLAFAVRQAALWTCSETGYKILPFLFRMIRKEPWQFFVNAVMATGLIAPEKREVQALFKEASSDSNPEVRKRIMTFLGEHPPAWASGIVEKLSRDQDPSIRQMAARSLAALKGKKGNVFPFPFFAPRVPDVPVKSSIRFGPLAKAVQDVMPLSHNHSHSYSETSCPRIIRDFRIGIFSQDKALFRKCRQELSSRCGNLPGYSNCIAQICNNPFDAAWFATLPAEIQTYALCTIFHRTMVYLERDADALAFTMKAPLFKSEPQSERAPLLYNLAARLIMGGRLNEAQEIIPEIEGPDYTGGLMGWLRFAEGKDGEAIELFESDLKELRRRLGKRNFNFNGIGGLFYVLALLKAQDGNLLKRADQLVGWSLPIFGDSDFRASAYRSLKGIVHAQKHEMEDAKKIIAGESKAGDVIPSLFNAIAAYWVNGHLSKETIVRIDSIFHIAREAEMNWVAAESAALLIRTDKETSARREFLDQVMKQSGMQPIVPSILAEEPWQKELRAIIQIAGEPEKSVGQKATAGTRLIWLVGYSNGKVSLQPIEQKSTARGEWSKGRSVAMSRLFNRTKLEYISKQDHIICAALKHERSYYYGDHYFFDMDSLLPALVGHPLLFLEKSPSLPVEFAKGEPEILVAKSGSKFKIKFAAELTEDRVMVIQETPTRFKVIELTEKHRRIAQVLGGRGLTVPASAREDVLRAVAALSAHALVHSDVSGTSKDVEEVASDPTPRVHLIPSGPGFRVEVFVKPFQEAGGPYLKPAVGAANIVAEVGGKKMQTKRDLKAEERMADAVDAISPTLSKLADSDRQWQLEDPEDCLQVLLDLKALQEKGQVVVEWPEGEKLRVTREISIDRFRLKIRSKTDWFEVSGGLLVDDSLVLDMKRLLDLLKTTNTRFIPLEEGRFLALTREFRKRLDELDAYADRKGKEIRLHPLAALAVQDLIKGIPNLEVDEAWKSRLERIRASQEISPPAPSTLKADLRDYQVEGYTWMARLAHMGIGACLADDMGLGKTIQALAIMLHRAAGGPTLVVAPTSVCWNWITEANRFTPTLNVMQFSANNRADLVKSLKHHDVLVTSYGLLVQEAELLSSVDWNIIVLDEAQAIKNVLTRRSQAAMGLKGDFRIITTGTPIENHLGELWTLFNFVNPGLLGSLQRFNERFAIPIEKNNNRDARRRLKRLIQPFILRRLKSQVLEELPPRTEVILQVEMSLDEAAFYEVLRQQALARIEADNAPIVQKHLKILAEITKLRQAACNPRLVISETPLTSSKLELFGEVVSELLENRHKALVFSQFVGHLSLIREYLDSRNIGYRYLDGSTPPKERNKEVDAFQSGDGDLFLISLRAGGLGLNLTAADYVIHMDPWWNPAVEDQASDRAHRIGQQRPVTVYRLVTRNTIEEKIVKLHQEKRDLAGSLLSGSDISGKISAEDLIRLIREE